MDSFFAEFGDIEGISSNSIPDTSEWSDVEFNQWNSEQFNTLESYKTKIRNIILKYRKSETSELSAESIVINFHTTVENSRETPALDQLFTEISDSDLNELTTSILQSKNLANQILLVNRNLVFFDAHRHNPGLLSYMTEIGLLDDVLQETYFEFFRHICNYDSKLGTLSSYIIDCRLFIKAVKRVSIRYIFEPNISYQDLELMSVIRRIHRDIDMGAYEGIQDWLKNLNLGKGYSCYDPVNFLTYIVILERREKRAGYYSYDRDEVLNKAQDFLRSINNNEKEVKKYYEEVEKIEILRRFRSLTVSLETIDPNELDTDTLSMSIPDTEGDPAKIQRKLTIDEMIKCYRDEDDLVKEIAQLRFVEELSVKKISERIGKSQNIVNDRLNRFRRYLISSRELRELLIDAEDDFANRSYTH